MPIAAALPYVAAGAGVFGAVSSADASRKSINAQKDALKAQRDIAANLKYEPVDIENLKQQAQQQAVSNAVNSLALERELSPDVAASRQMVAQRVREDLSLGGQLSPDVANQVARASRTTGALSGAPAGPLTAAQIGITGEQLRQSRLAQGMGLLQQNKLPTAGLDPGALASLMVSQNSALNQFNADKAGVARNLAQSAGEVGAGMAAQQGAATSGLLNSVFGAQAPGTGGLLGQISKLPIFGQSPGSSDPYKIGTGFAPTPGALAGKQAFDMPAIPGSVTPTFNFGM